MKPYNFNKLCIVVYLDLTLTTTIQPGRLSPGHFLHVIGKESQCCQFSLIREDGFSKDVLDFLLPVISFRLALTVLYLDGFAILADVGLNRIGIVTRVLLPNLRISPLSSSSISSRPGSVPSPISSRPRSMLSSLFGVP
jgi:hypothetical protein